MKSDNICESLRSLHLLIYHTLAAQVAYKWHMNDNNLNINVVQFAGKIHTQIPKQYVSGSYSIFKQWK
jgi:hypothetical protein